MWKLMNLFILICFTFCVDAHCIAPLVVAALISGGATLLGTAANAYISWKGMKEQESENEKANQFNLDLFGLQTEIEEERLEGARRERTLTRRAGIREAGRERKFRAGEAEERREFEAEEGEKSRFARGEELGKIQEFEAGEAEKVRGFKTEEAEKGRLFRGEELGKIQEFEAGEAEKARKFKSEETRKELEYKNFQTFLDRITSTINARPQMAQNLITMQQQRT